MIQTAIRQASPKSLKLLEKNARYMNGAQFKRLVENVKRDGKLTSLPLVHRGEVLSGNHRVQAAIEAGLAEIEYIEITSELTDQQRVAIQLSHNAVVGQDDPSILQELYATLDLDWKEYSGLTDDAFDFHKIDIEGIGIGAPEYQEISIQFLPAEREEFVKLVKRIEKAKRLDTVLVADRRDFEEFFDVLTKAKLKLDIHNTALALVAMARLADAALEAQDAAKER